MRVLPKDLLEQVAETLSGNELLAPGEKIAVAVSGGADSVTLLHILHRLRDRFKIELLVLHVNHQLRGVDSEEEEQFVRGLADSLGLEALVRRSSRGPGNLEQEARQARRAFFAEVLASGQANKIALGHNASDQAETVLFRFLRGSGAAGLAGMRLNHQSLLRPLLTISRADVRTWAVKEGLVWREDSSNRDLRFSRNWLRERLIPQIEARLNSGLEPVLNGMAHICQGEEDYWSELIEAVYRSGVERSRYGLLCDVEWFRTHPAAVQRRLVRRIFHEVQGHLRSIDFAHVEAVRALTHSLQAHDRVIVPGIDIMRSFGSLRFRAAEVPEEQRHYRLTAELATVSDLPFGGRICLERVPPGLPICANFKKEPALAGALHKEIAEIDEDALLEASHSYCLYIRNWEPGDQMHQAGHRAPESLKSLFQVYRVLLWERKHWPVLLSGDEIIWARRFGVAARFAPTERTERVLRVTYEQTVYRTK